MANQKPQIRKTNKLIVPNGFFGPWARLLICMAIVLMSSSFFTNASPMKPSDPSFLGNLLSSGKDSFPVPPNNPKQLFYLQRTANSNTIIAEINLNAKGQLDAANPVHVYWIRYAENGEKKELNYIQRTFAYGIKSEAINSTNFWIHFVSYSKLKFKLTFSTKENRYLVLANINKKEAILKKLFVKIDGGSFWVPNVLYMEMKGIDPVTGKEVIERFKP